MSQPLHSFRCPPLAAACLSACLAWGAALALPVTAQAQTANSAKPRKAAKTPAKTPARLAVSDVTLDFDNASIESVARAMATLSGRNVVVDPRVKGTMTLSSTTPVTPDEAMRLFAAQLRTQGFAMVESDGMALVLPEAEAKLRSGSVQTRVPQSSGNGQVQTQIFRLTHENAANLVPVLRPLISPNNTINVSPGGNALVITDYSDNLQRIGRIIASLDISNATGVEVVPLKHAIAADLAPLVLRLAESSGAASLPAAGMNGGLAPQVGAAAGGAFPTTLIPEPRSNSIIVRAANPAKLAQIKGLIQQLDLPSATHDDGSSGNIHIVHLKNADAVKLAVTLRAALAALPGQQQANAGAGGAATANAAAAATSSGGNRNSASGATGSNGGLNTGPSINAENDNQPSTGGQIQADPATNSLIISAPAPIYRELREVIDKLDQRRAQVFVESLIAEVNADKAAEFGIQWQGLLGRRNGSNVGIIGTNYNAGSTNILSLMGQFANGKPSARDLVMPSQGMNLALGHRVNGVLTLGALANFLQSTGTGNVLSTPTLLTLDNEEARIIVGQNVPIVTGSYTTNTGGQNNNLNPFQTYERQDVGLTLRVRPQIGENGTVKMVIYQESSNVLSESNAGPVTRKRAIESSVLVDDGSIVVLGGLLEDQYQSGVDKVPGLGDIPVVGNLFKSEKRKLVKTNLMVFLRPVVVRDAAATEQFSVSRYDMMRAEQQGNQPDPSSVLKVNIAPVMPPAQPVYQDEWKRETPPAPLNHNSAAPGSAAAPRQEPRRNLMPAAGESNYLSD